MKSYDNIVRRVLADGRPKSSRGASTLSLFNVSWKHDMRESFPIVQSKFIPWKSVVLENIWFLSGNPNTAFLKNHGVNFWDPWTDSDGNVDSPYGYFWRNWGVQGIDQLQYVLNNLKNNPGSRRNVITAWDPANVQNSGLPPCHIMQIFHTEEQPDGSHLLNLHVTQRSADLALGVPFNMAGYGLILELMARFAGMKAGQLGITFVDCHIYAEGEYDHRPGLYKQLRHRYTDKKPWLEIHSHLQSLDDVLYLMKGFSTDFILKGFALHDYKPGPKIPFKALV